VAFIDFSQAYDMAPRPYLWQHLQRNVMSAPLLRVIRDMYENDKHVLIDGDKRAQVHLINGINKTALCHPCCSH